MEPIVGLPKTAHIVCSLHTDFEIKNRRIVSHSGGFMDWLLGVIARNEWRDVLSQMISQGFRLNGIIEHCIKEMQDPELFANMLAWINNEFYNVKFRRKFTSSVHAKTLIRYITGILLNCKNWDDLFDALRWGSYYQDDIKEKIKDIMKLCENT